jgi:hypothetical protein
MLIGPHVHSPPIIPAFNSIAGILCDAEVLTEGRLHPPAGMGVDGALDYRMRAVEYFPLVELYESENDAARAYADFARQMDVPRESTANSTFLKQGSAISSLLDTRIGDIAGIFRSVRIPAENVSSQLPEMASRADFFGRYTVRQLAHLLHWADDNPAMPTIGFSSEGLTNLATDIYYLSHIVGDDDNYTKAQEAGLAFISGVIYWGEGSENSMEDAAHSFSASSILFSDVGNPIASAIAAEAEAFINKYKLKKPATENEAFERAAEQWHIAARGMGIKDVAGVYLAAYRGLLNSISFTGGRSYRTRLELEARLAFMNDIRGKHLEAAYDHVRRAFDLIKSFNGDPNVWLRIADTVRLAIGCFKKVPGHDSRVIRELEAVEELARREGHALERDLAEIKGEMGIDIEDHPHMRFDRGRARIAHGDLIGGMRDLEWAKDSESGNAWYLSEVGLARHHLAYLVATFGDAKGARNFLEGAKEYLELAADIAKESGVNGPIFEARVGALHVSTGDYEEALNRLTRAYEIDPGLKGLEEYLSIARSHLDEEQQGNVRHLRPVQ